jgi:hypothetical protein
MYMYVPGPIDISSQSKRVFIAISKMLQISPYPRSMGRKHVLGPPMNLGVGDDETVLLVQWCILVLKRELKTERGRAWTGSTDDKLILR